MEQNYPKGGKEGRLTKLIEKCLMAMYGNSDVREKYVNDQRFLEIWIKYVSCHAPSTVIAHRGCFCILKFFGIFFPEYAGITMFRFDIYSL